MSSHKNNASPGDLMGYFRDPPHVLPLLEGKRGSQFFEAQVVSRKPQRTNLEDRPESGYISRYSLLRYTSDGRNQAYVLVAVLFLIGELQELVISLQEKKDLIPPNFDRHFFGDLATTLEAKEQALEGVTGTALLAMHDQLLKSYAELREAVTETGEEATPTHLLRLVEKLFDLNEAVLEYAPSKSVRRGKRRQTEERYAQSQSSEPDVTNPLQGMNHKRRKEEQIQVQSGSHPVQETSTMQKPVERSGSLSDEQLRRRLDDIFRTAQMLQLQVVEIRQCLNQQ
ncbi:hypothetical protein EMPS_09906 [Entomortierella parvispora]|uniref:Uncharacterized protein n=1 Tax=Entomortierella parvispora TaxID=205924 RepID=A0A9P3HJ19_9FUNG|nr:hypothetical protein EMPS_09906 [Entomortierella parvispora]